MLKTLHPVAGALALTMILAFWLASAWAEMFGSLAALVAVKTTIPWALGLVILAMAATGLSGARLGRKMRGPVIAAKQRRMALSAANGLLVLVPAALFLAMKARAGAFDGWFYAVQALEFAAGALNITLLARNMRDGLRMTRRRKGARA